MEGKDLKWVYDTILSGPGMEEQVKLSYSVNRKLVLLLAEIIERGIEVKGNGLVESVDKGLLNDLRELSNSCIEKAGLTQLKENLKNFK